MLLVTYDAVRLKITVLNQREMPRRSVTCYSSLLGSSANFEYTGVLKRTSRRLSAPRKAATEASTVEMVLVEPSLLTSYRMKLTTAAIDTRIVCRF